MAIIYTKKEKKSIIIRSILFVSVLIAFGVILTVILLQMRVKPGIHEIKAESLTCVSAPKSYHLYYYLENTSEEKAQDMQAKANTLYSNALDNIYSLLDSDKEYEDCNNLWYLNHHPNEDVVIDSELYRILKDVYEYDPSYLYMGGLYEYWNNLMYTTDSNMKLISDPLFNEDYANLIGEFVKYEGIALVFKENNTVELCISSDYVNILDNDETKYIDLGPLKTAYIFDYIKGCFAGANMKNGYLYSTEGYILDLGMDKDIEFSFQLLANKDETNHILGDVKIQSGYSYYIVYGFPTSVNYFYQVNKDGNSYMRTSYINPTSGMPAAPENSRVTYQKGNLVGSVKAMYSYLFESSIIGKYIAVDSKLKIHTNDKANEFSSYEVIYE